MAHELTESLRETLGLFDHDKTPLTTSEVADRLELGRRSAYDRLERLVEKEWIETKKVGASARVWWRPGPDIDAASESHDASTVAESIVEVLTETKAGVCILDADGTVAWVNETAGEYFEFDRSTVIGQDKITLIEDKIAPVIEDPAWFSKTIREAYEDDAGARQFECHVTPTEGRQERWLDHYSEPIDSGTFAGGRVELYYDVTDYRRNEGVRKADRDQFESFVEAVEEYAIFLLDPDGRIQTWNDGARRIKGYDREEILGEHVSVFYTEEDRAAGVPEANLEAAATTGETEDAGWRVRADGTQFWATVTITALRDDDGTLDGFAKVTRDMTKRRASERELKEEKAFVESLFETQHDLAYAFDDQGNLLRWNDRIKTVTGYSDAELGDMHPLNLVADDAVDEAADVIATVMNEGKSVTAEFPLETADGTRIPYEFSGAPITEDGDIVGLTGVGRDVSDRKRRRAELERQRDELEAELQEVYQRVDDGFFAVDEDWRFTHVNAEAEELLDRSAAELVGKTLWGEFPEAVDTEFQVAYERAMETQTQVTIEEYYPPLETWFEVAIYPSESGLSVYFRDIDDRKARERDLERYKTIVETISDGIYVVDEGGYVTEVNSAYETMIGQSREELVGAHVSDIVDDDSLLDRAQAVEADLRNGQSSATIETELTTTAGDTWVAEATFALFSSGDEYERVGVVRDITDRRARERRLQQRLIQQEGVAELGRRALSDLDVDALLADAAKLLAETLDADYSGAFDLDPAADHLSVRQGVGWATGTVGSRTVPVEDDSQTAYTLGTGEPVVFTDLSTETRFSGPALLREHDVRSGISTVMGSHDDPWGVLGVYDRAAEQFSDSDVVFVQSVANVLSAAITQQEHERELVRQRERVAALNNLNDVVRGIADAVIDQSTREEIEQTVCEHLADSESYQFAWIGDVEVGSQRVLSRAEAGIEGYLADVTITTDPDDEHGQGPTGRAFRSREIEYARRPETDDRYEPWRRQLETYDYRSSVAIPIIHEETLYGVLNVYTARENAFEAEERAMIAELGEIIGHAIAATNRKRALMSDEMTELSFLATALTDSLGLSAEMAGTITIDHAVAIGDDEFLVYGSVTEDAVDELETMAAFVPQWESMTIRDGRFEARLSEPPLFSAVAAVGGSVDAFVIEHGTAEITVHLPPGANARRIVDIVEEAYPSVQLQKRQQSTVSFEPTDREGRRVDLTDRQRTVLEAAYHAGLFEWPRSVSGEDVADSLGIAASTFNQHIRKAERQVIEQYLSMT